METLGKAVGREQMRLICPNCDAEYEVDAAAIPDVGRDVQCSNCGHAWFQAAPDMVAVPVTEAFDDTPPEEPDLPVPPTAPTPDAPPAQSVDASVMAILKEEADRELAARRAEAVPVETQPDLGLEAAETAARARQISAIRGEAAQAADTSRQVTRRELLPNIEEINSTLRPSAAVRHDEADDDNGLQSAMPIPQPRSGFRSGFILMLVLAAVLVTVYVMAPRLAQQIPGAKGALDAYIAVVDQARIGLDGITKSVVGALQRLAGSE